MPGLFFPNILSSNIIIKIEYTMKIVVAFDNSGFVGNRICQLLDRTDVEIVKLHNNIDLSEENVIDRIPKADHFIHMANLVHVPTSYQDPYSFYRVNYMTTLNALEYCRKNQAHLIYASSYIYGAPDYLPVDEKHPIKPFNPYAQTKAICEKLCEGYSRDFGVEVTILRIFNVYGEGQGGNLLIPELMAQIKEGEKIIHLKSGEPRRDFVYVDDVANAFVTCLDMKNSYSVYNICSGVSYSIKELTEIIKKHLNYKLDFVFSDSDRKNEVDETVGSYEKIKNELGWVPQVVLEEGLLRTLQKEIGLSFTV